MSQYFFSRMTRQKKSAGRQPSASEAQQVSALGRPTVEYRQVSPPGSQACTESAQLLVVHPDHAQRQYGSAQEYLISSENRVFTL